jgi:hypothetical protein
LLVTTTQQPLRKDLFDGSESSLSVRPVDNQVDNIGCTIVCSESLASLPQGSPVIHGLERGLGYRTQREWSYTSQVGSDKPSTYLPMEESIRQCRIVREQHAHSIECQPVG